MTNNNQVKKFVLFALGCATFFIFSSLLHAQPDTGTDNTRLANEILFYVNQHRAEQGLPALQMNQTIVAAANKHSADMAGNIVPFGHNGFEERIGNLMKELAPAHAGAENVAKGELDAKAVVALWLHSPGHRKNIEGNFNLTGIGIARGADGDLYFTQIFIKKG